MLALIYDDYVTYILIFLSGNKYSKYIPKSFDTIIFSSYSIVYLGSLIYLYMDSNYGWWTKFKRNNSKKTTIEFVRLLPRIIINDTLGYLCYHNILLPISKNRGLTDNDHEIYIVLTDFVAIFLIFDFFFYFFHRLIHHPILYRHIHKIHHSTFADIAITTHYMGVFDYFLEVIIPYWITISLWDSCFLASFLFAVIGQLNGVITHGGYKFMFLPKSDNHMDHHLYFNKNFGIGGPWDFLLNTN